MTFPQQPQYPQQPQGQPQGPAPQYQPNGPQSQYPMQPMPQYPQPPIANRNPFFEWLKQTRRDFSRIGASLCLMVVIWYALATVLEGALYAAVGGKGEAPNWVTYVGSGVPLYLIAMPMTLTRDCSLTDDPLLGREALAALRTGDSVTLLAFLNSEWAYVETTIENQPCRAFIPRTALMEE